MGRWRIGHTGGRDAIRMTGENIWGSFGSNFLILDSRDSRLARFAIREIREVRDSRDSRGPRFRYGSRFAIRLLPKSVT